MFNRFSRTHPLWSVFRGPVFLCFPALRYRAFKRRLHATIGTHFPWDRQFSIRIGKPFLLYSRSCGNEACYDLVVTGMISAQRPLTPTVERPTQGCSAKTVVFHVHGRFPFQKRFHCACMASVGSPVPSCFAMRLCDDIHAFLQQKIDD